SFVAHTGLVPGQLQRGYFEPIGLDVGLALEDDAGDDIFPNLGRDRDGDVSVPPGTSAVLPLDVPGGYHIVAQGGSLPPNVAFGFATHPVAGSIQPEPARPQPPDTVFGNGQQLDILSGRLGLVPWDVAHPWRVVSERLQRLTRACSD